MSGILPTGHRRRGAGLTLEQIPDLERAIILARHKGRTVYVDSAVSSSGNGDTWGGAYSTLAAALAAALADDMILVAPGHAETVTATNLAAAKARVTVVGLGIGASRPTFTYGAAAATITISAAGVVFSNCHFVANFLNVVTAFTVGAAKDFTVTDCSFIDTSSVLNFLCIVTTSATNNEADGLCFNRNYVYGLAATDGAVISVLGNNLRIQASDNVVDKAATNNAGHFITLSSKIVGGIRLMNNILTVVGASGATVGIFGTGSGTTSSGIIAGNFASSLDTTTALFFTASTGISFLENYLTGAVDKSGTLFPSADDPA